MGIIAQKLNVLTVLAGKGTVRDIEGKLN